MAQITNGVRAILSNPLVYSALQSLMGANSFRKSFVETHVKPFPGMRILDIGCGPADILDHLPRVTYWGFDISSEYISTAKKKYGERGIFRCKLFEVTDLEYLPKFDFVMLSGVLHHLDDHEAHDVIRLTSLALKKGGKLVTVDPCLTPDQNPVARYLIKKDRGQNVRTEDGYRSLIGHGLFDSIDLRVVHKAWIPYTHCYMVNTR